MYFIVHHLLFARLTRTYPSHVHTAFLPADRLCVLCKCVCMDVHTFTVQQHDKIPTEARLLACLFVSFSYINEGLRVALANV